MLTWPVAFAATVAVAERRLEVTLRRVPNVLDKPTRGSGSPTTRRSLEGKGTKCNIYRKYNNLSHSSDKHLCKTQNKIYTDMKISLWHKKSKLVNNALMNQFFKTNFFKTSETHLLIIDLSMLLARMELKRSYCCDVQGLCREGKKGYSLDAIHTTANASSRQRSANFTDSSHECNARGQIWNTTISKKIVAKAIFFQLFTQSLILNKWWKQPETRCKSWA